MGKVSITISVNESLLKTKSFIYKDEITGLLLFDAVSPDCIPWYGFKVGESDFSLRGKVRFTMLRDNTVLSLFIQKLGTHASCDNLLFEEREIQSEEFADLRAYNKHHESYCGSLKASHLKHDDKIVVEWDLGELQIPKFAEAILLCSIAQLTLQRVELLEMFQRLAALP